MFNVNASVWIDRSVEDVFAFTADFENSMTWQADVTRSEQTSDGPVGVGTTGVFGQKVMGREIENDVEVTAYDPPYEMCFNTLSGPVSFTGCQICEEQDGGTLFTITIDAEGAGFFKVAEGLLKGQVQSSIERDLGILKEVMEG